LDQGLRIAQNLNITGEILYKLSILKIMVSDILLKTIKVYFYWKKRISYDLRMANDLRIFIFFNLKIIYMQIMLFLI